VGYKFPKFVAVEGTNERVHYLLVELYWDFRLALRDYANLNSKGTDGP